MRWKSIYPLLLTAVLAAPAFASMGSGSKEPEPASSTPSTPSTNDASTSSQRQGAERDYGDAYNEIAKAKKDLEAKKDKNADKRFHKALDRARSAVEKDSTYHEAWNLVGYASRKLKDYDHAVAAYLKCLSIKSDYAPAREYLGEAYLEMGKVDKAREQLTMLESQKAADSVTELKASIDAYVAAHPDAAAAAPDSSSARSSSAPADTAVTKQ